MPFALCEVVGVILAAMNLAASAEAPTGPTALTRPALEALRAQVLPWFTREALHPLIAGADADTRTAALAVGWLAGHGKRWRPLLTVASCRALADHPATPPPALRHLAVAVECFHKASLIHDDIEDGDLTRYGAKTLHAEHGIALAINTGDFLIGEGYRLIAQCGLPAEVTARMVASAAEGQRRLCLGQGEELALRTDAAPPDEAAVLAIFRRKTAPAFDVALQLGALAAGADTALLDRLTEFSDALGVAYQVRDDIEDSHAGDDGDAARGRLSILPTLERRCPGAAEQEALRLFASQRDRALAGLRAIAHPGLRAVLSSLASAILDGMAVVPSPGT